MKLAAEESERRADQVKHLSHTLLGHLELGRDVIADYTSLALGQDPRAPKAPPPSPLADQNGQPLAVVGEKLLDGVGDDDARGKRRKLNVDRYLPSLLDLRVRAISSAIARSLAACSSHRCQVRSSPMRTFAVAIARQGRPHANHSHRRRATTTPPSD